MNIFLVRHAEYDNPKQIFPYHLPVTLSKEGRQRAQRVGLWLKEQGFPGILIHSSPIVRTLQTAEIIAAATNSHVYVNEDLIEVRWSKLQGKLMPENNDWSMCYVPGVQEEPESMLARMLRVYQERLAANQDCILVGHGDPLTLLYYHLIGKTPPRRLDTGGLYVQKGEVIHLTVENSKVVTIKRQSP